jgi:hypothetical protein
MIGIYIYPLDVQCCNLDHRCQQNQRNAKCIEQQLIIVWKNDIANRK